MTPNARTFLAHGLFALWVFAVSSTDAATIYDTFEPEPIVTQHLVYWSYDLQIGRSLADPFTLTNTSYSIASVTLDISHAEEYSANLRIGIYDDAAGFPSTVPITYVDPNPTDSISGQRQILTYSFPNQPILSPNVPYWLVLEPARVPGTNNNDEVTYAFGTSRAPPFPASTTRTYENGQWGVWENLSQNSFAFSLDGTAVPEPRAWALFGLGGLFFWYGAVRRRIFDL